MVHAYFVSDIHIQNLTDPRARAFLNFLRLSEGPNCLTPASSVTPQRESFSQVEVLRLSLRETDPTAAGPPIKKTMTHLFLVGDIFDLWIADHDYFAETYQLLVKELVRLKSEGVEIFYFEGNHDLYLQNYWQKKLGFKVFSNAHVFNLGPIKVRVEHGDLIDPEDRGYRFLRWVLRSRPMVWLAQSLPERAVVKIGEQASQKSRVYTSEVKTVSSTEAVHKIRAHAERVATVEDYDLLVNGHVHVFDDHTFLLHGRARRSVNLGSWLDEYAHILKLVAHKN